MIPKYVRGPVDKAMDNGLLVDVIEALRAVSDGELFGVLTTAPAQEGELAKWGAITGNALLASSRKPPGTLHVFRRGRAHAAATAEAGVRVPPPIGSRLFIYTNFDCNLSCTYCCVRSSPTARPRRMALSLFACIVDEAASAGVQELFLTGGEPLLHSDAIAMMEKASSVLPTTVMTNAALVKGSVLEAIERLPRERLAFQVSLDSPTPEMHDLYRGVGTWSRATRGARALRQAGFRVRIAGTIRTDAEARALDAHLDETGIPVQDRVIRRQALRGLAEEGLALVRSELHPDVTLTADGVYYHPVGADDDDLLIATSPVPVADAIDAVRRAAATDRSFDERLASIFICA